MGQQELHMLKYPRFESSLRVVLQVSESKPKEHSMVPLCTDQGSSLEMNAKG